MKNLTLIHPVESINQKSILITPKGEKWIALENINLTDDKAREVLKSIKQGDFDDLPKKDLLPIVVGIFLDTEIGHGCLNGPESMRYFKDYCEHSFGASWDDPLSWDIE